VSGGYDDPDLYEAALAGRAHDIAYFLALADEARGPVLEYGCGSGRVTLPLAERGHSVLGVDQSSPMLRRLKERLRALEPTVRSRVRLERGDMRRYEPEERFALVLATFNVVGHLHSFQDMARFLRQAAKGLGPGAELVFDVPLPAAEETEADPDERIRLPALRHPKSGVLVEHDERYEYDRQQQLLLVESDHWLGGKRPKPANRLTTRLVLRQWFPRELESLLSYEGFTVRLTADYTGAPLALAEDMIVVHAKKRARGPLAQRGRRTSAIR
jgi:SAM-dependent methyltransferase